MVRMSTTSQTATNEQAKNEKEMRNNCWKNWAAPKRSKLSNFKVDSNWSGRQWSSWDWCQETQYAVWTFGRCAQRMPLHLQRFIAGRYKQNSLQNDPSPSSKHRPTTKASQWCNLMSLSQWDQVTNTATQQHTQTDTLTHTQASRQATAHNDKTAYTHQLATLETAVASYDNSNNRQKHLTMAAASQDALQAAYVDFSELALREVSIIHVL